mgnify:FL=1
MLRLEGFREAKVEEWGLEGVGVGEGFKRVGLCGQYEVEKLRESFFFFLEKRKLIRWWQRSFGVRVKSDEGVEGWETEYSYLVDGIAVRGRGRTPEDDWLRGTLPTLTCSGHAYRRVGKAQLRQFCRLAGLVCARRKGGA